VLATIVKIPPFRWWLQDPVTRATFLLLGAYLGRDRDVKLRVYPGLAPMLVMPMVLLLQDHSPGSSGFGVAFAGSYLGLIPLLAMGLLRHSQQWQASDLFRFAPLPGPALFCHGLRRAVLALLVLPALGWVVLLAWVIRGDLSHLPLLLPGVIALPVYSMIPCLRGKAVPFSLPTEEAKSATRGLSMIGFVFVSMGVAGLAIWSWSGGWFSRFLAVELLLAIGIYLTLRLSVTTARWPSLE
jgi:hypothetical protein